MGPRPPLALWGMARLTARAETTVTLASDPAHRHLTFLERQTRRLRGRAVAAQKDISDLINSVALNSAFKIFIASYHCPLHEHRAGPREGPGTCPTCHPATPLIVGTETLHALCQEAVHALIQAHLAELVEDEAASSPPSDPLVPMRLDWFDPNQVGIPPPAVPVGEVRQPLAPLPPPQA